MALLCFRRIPEECALHGGCGCVHIGSKALCVLNCGVPIRAQVGLGFTGMNAEPVLIGSSL